MDAYPGHYGVSKHALILLLYTKKSASEFRPAWVQVKANGGTYNNIGSWFPYIANSQHTCTHMYTTINKLNYCWLSLSIPSVGVFELSSDEASP